jgi:hypothetical protein
LWRCVGGPVVADKIVVVAVEGLWLVELWSMVTTNSTYCGGGSRSGKSYVLKMVAVKVAFVFVVVPLLWLVLPFLCDDAWTRPNHQLYVMLPAAPVLLGLAVTVPIVIGLVVLFLPLALPLVVALLVAVCTLGLVATLTYASTRAGRALLTPLVQPLAHTLLSTPVGQGLVYNIGPRPTPVLLCRSILPTDIWFRLALSIVLDGLGSASYLLPGLGEGFDVALAPIQTIFIMALYNHNNAPSAMDYLKYVSMAEELLPFTDVLPTATIGWCMEYGIPLVTMATASGKNASPLNGNQHYSTNSQTIAPPSTTTTAPTYAVPFSPSLHSLLQKQQ